jgi:tetratricopeptide (TPR) repeat protein
VWRGLERAPYVWRAEDYTPGMAVDDKLLAVASIDEAIDVKLVREGRLPNLQSEFADLGEALDRWLAGGHRKRSQGLPTMWLMDEAPDQRSKGLMASLARAAATGYAVGDVGSDLTSAVQALGRSIEDPHPALSVVVVGVDLRDDQSSEPWTELREALMAERRRPSPHRRSHVALVVAGTSSQARAAYEELGDLVELTTIETNGRPQARAYSHDGIVDSSDRVYNRGLPITSHELFGRERELRQLRLAWEANTRVVSVVAVGGAGKSALVNRWLREMRDDDYRGAERVLIWSFYSQGTRDNLVSADIFVNAALSWLGDKGAVTLNPAAKGDRLASLIKRHKMLVVLDGLEPLQHPPEAPKVGGRLTDNSIRELLRQLAEPDWDGLCVVTTRVGLMDLAPFEAADGDGGGRVLRSDLGPLDQDAGEHLLQHLIGGRSDPCELRDAVREVGGHALAVALLGNYIREVHKRDLARRVYLQRLPLQSRQGGHARRIMAAYADWLGENERFGELAILNLIGLFNRPAEPEAMGALLADRELRKAMSIDRVDGGLWERCVGSLKEMGLLNREVAGAPGTLDAHPLVREHFRDELQAHRPELWLEGHRVLYRYYRDSKDAPRWPSTSAEMQPLYAAAMHGCAAGLHQEVFDEVLLERVWRDRRTNYSTRRLGMTGADLVALSNYFLPARWTEIGNIELSPAGRVLVLTNAGVRLRQLGQLADARASFAAMAREIDPRSAGAEDMEAASYGASQYCELLVIDGKLGVPDRESGDGELESALESALSAVEYGDRGDDPYFAMHARSSLAEVHFMRGELEDTRGRFQEAMEIEREAFARGSGVRPPFLYSQTLFRYGYHLIERGRAQDLLDAAAAGEDWGTNGEDSSLLSKAIRLLVLGAARRSLIEGGLRTRALLSETMALLDESYAELRNAGYPDYVVRGLLERAHFHRVRGERENGRDDYRAARKDLETATYEAERGEMDLLYADILIQRTACYLDFWDRLGDEERSEARERIPTTLAEANGLVHELGYKRRTAMVASLRERAKRVVTLPPPPADEALKAG